MIAGHILFFIVNMLFKKRKEGKNATSIPEISE